MTVYSRLIFEVFPALKGNMFLNLEKWDRCETEAWKYVCLRGKKGEKKSLKC